MNSFGEDFINGFITMGYLLCGNIEDHSVTSKVSDYLKTIYFFEYRQNLDVTKLNAIDDIVNDMIEFNFSDVELRQWKGTIGPILFDDDTFVIGALVLYKLLSSSVHINFTNKLRSQLRNLLDIIYFYKKRSVFETQHLKAIIVKKNYEKASKYLKTFYSIREYVSNETLSKGQYFNDIS